MLKKGYLKPKLTIELIGKQYFWYGIALWFLASNIICLGSNFLREIMRLLVWKFDGDLFMRSIENFNKFDLFFSFLSTTIAFGFTIYFWHSKINHRKKRQFIRYSKYVSIMYIFLILTIILRFSTTLYIILYNMESDDSILGLMDNFWYIFLLIPVYIFFNFWNSTMYVFRTKFWVLISMIVIVISSLLFDRFLSIDKEIANSIYYRKYSIERSFVDKQFEIAKSYGIEYSDEAEEAIKKRAQRTTQYLVTKTKKSFETQGKVSLEFLFMEKILVHNCNRNRRYYSIREYGEVNWSYALPEQIYYQIMLYDNPECIEVTLLFDILNEQIKLFNTPDWGEVNFEEMSRYETRRFYFGRNLFYSTETILSRLIQVRDKLYENEKYSEYRELLPELEFRETRRQEWIELEL